MIALKMVCLYSLIIAACYAIPVAVYYLHKLAEDADNKPKGGFAFILILFFLSSCSIQQRCHKLEARIAKDSRYCNLILKDTITVKDTVYLGTVRKDSTFVMQKEIDTFYINQDRLHVKIIKEFDTLRVEGQCDSIFIIKEILVPVEYVHVKELNTFLRSFGKFFKRWFWVLIVIAAAAVVYRFRSKIPFLS